MGRKTRKTIKLKEESSAINAPSVSDPHMENAPIRSLLDEGETPDVESQVVSDLESFRSQWEEELHEKKRKNNVPNNKVEDMARDLFLEGVACELRGEMSEAVNRYTKAFRMVPDIERRVHQPTLASQTTGESTKDLPDVLADDDPYWVYQVCSQRLCERMKLIEPANQGFACPIDRLLKELLSLIIRAAIGGQMDTRSLSSLSETCSVFYTLCRENDIWRSMVEKSVGTKIAERRAQSSYRDWRELFLSTPHILFDGVYVSKSTYIRHGETGFQDQNYRPWHTVVYYRLIRFWPDGTIHMVTSNELPQSSVLLLKEKDLPESDTSTLFGRWWMYDDDLLTAEVRRQQETPKLLHTRSRASNSRLKNVPEYTVAGQSFYIDLRLIGKGRRWGLTWKKNVCHVSYGNWQTGVNDLEVEKNTQAFPPMRFFRVKSFITEWDGIL